MKSITESFNTANSSTLGPDLTWTETEGNLQIVSNRAQNVTNGTVSARAETALDTDDQSVTALITAATDPSNLFCGIFLRADASALTWYEALAYFNGFGAAVRISKVIAGSRTILGSENIELTEGTPQRCRFEARGSTLRFLVENVGLTRFDEWLRITDTAIPTGKYTGIVGSKTPSGDVIWDNFAAQDVSPIQEVGSGAQCASVATTSEVASQTLAFPSNVVSGNLLIVGGTVWQTGGPPASIVVSDSLDTQYTVLAGVGGDSKKPFIAYGIAPSSGANTVTVNPTGSAYISFGIDEFSSQYGIVFDVDGGMSTGTGLNPSVNMTPLADNALVVGVVDISKPKSPGSGYTQIAETEDASAEQFNLEFKILTTAAALTTVNWVTDESFLWYIHRASFRAEAATPSFQSAWARGSNILL